LISIVSKILAAAALMGAVQDVKPIAPNRAQRRLQMRSAKAARRRRFRAMLSEQRQARIEAEGSCFMVSGHSRFCKQA